MSGMDEKIAHGAGLSALWASWARYVYKDDVSRFAQYAVNVWNIEMDFEHPEKTALAGIQATEDYFKSLDMPVSLRELNVCLLYTSSCVSETGIKRGDLFKYPCCH